MSNNSQFAVRTKGYRILGLLIIALLFGVCGLHTVDAIEKNLYEAEDKIKEDSLINDFSAKIKFPIPDEMKSPVLEFLKKQRPKQLEVSVDFLCNRIDFLENAKKEKFSKEDNDTIMLIAIQLSLDYYKILTPKITILMLYMLKNKLGWGWKDRRLDK